MTEIKRRIKTFIVTEEEDRALKIWAADRKMTLTKIFKEEVVKKAMENLEVKY